MCIEIKHALHPLLGIFWRKINHKAKAMVETKKYYFEYHQIGTLKPPEIADFDD